MNICLFTQNVTDTKVSNLDVNKTIIRASLAEDVGRLEVVVKNGRMLTVEERQSCRELTDQSPNTKFWKWLDCMGRQVILQGSLVAVLHHNAKIPCWSMNDAKYFTMYL